MLARRVIDNCIFLVLLCAFFVLGNAAGINSESNSFRMKCPHVHLDPADPANYCSERLIEGNLQVGEACLIRPDQCRPTQMSIGRVVARCLTDKLQSMSANKLKKFLQQVQVPTVVSPSNDLYILDQHHLAYAMYAATFDFRHQMEHRVMYACIDSDYRSKSKEEFLGVLKDRGQVYLKDERGGDIEPESVPLALKDMRDDPFRTLAEWLESANGFIKCGMAQTLTLEQCLFAGDAPLYLEFAWANYMRERLPNITGAAAGGPDVKPHLPDFVYRTNLQEQVAGLYSVWEQAKQMALSSDSQDMVGYNWSRDVFGPKNITITRAGCVDEVETGWTPDNEVDLADEALASMLPRHNNLPVQLRVA